ncbi:MAG: STAS domain-containing protein [Pseudomonadota bacterium]
MTYTAFSFSPDHLTAPSAFTGAEAGGFAQSVEAAFLRGAAALTIDLSDTRSIDASGFAVLARSFKQALVRRIELSIVGAEGAVAEMLKGTPLAQANRSTVRYLANTNAPASGAPAAIPAFARRAA